MKEQNQISDEIVNPKAAGIDMSKQKPFCAIIKKENT
jgi:hypothetical protein